MVIKLIGGLLVFVSCTWLGKAVSDVYKCRIRLLENMRAIFQMFESEIRYSMQDMAELFQKASKIAINENQLIFSECLSALQKSDGVPLSEIWTYAVSKVRFVSGYIPEDISVLKGFGNILGTGDAQTQLSNINLFTANIDGRISDAKNALNKKGKTASKLGIYVGMILIIILI